MQKDKKNLKGQFIIISIFLILTTLANAKVPEIVLEQKKAVVTIYVHDRDGKQIATGSGFIVDSNGIIVTNYHVILKWLEKKDNTLLLKMESGAYLPIGKPITYDVANLIFHDTDFDVVIFKADAKGLQTVKLGTKYEPKQGEDIVVIGSPFGLETTVSDGIISSIRGEGKIIQITAPISPGSSGSPVFNFKGEVVGVATFLLKEGQNLNFAIPIKYVANLIEESKTKKLKPKYSRPPEPQLPEKIAPPSVEMEVETEEAYQEILKPFSIDKYGFIDKTGKVVIKHQFDGADIFSEGLAGVKIGDKWGFIDKTGKIVIKPQFDKAVPFSEGLSAVKIGTEWGFIDRTGEIVIKPQFDEAHGFIFSEGFSAIKVGNNWGFIDKAGEIIIKHQFDGANIFSEGLAAVKIKDKWGFIDKTGRVIINPQFDDAFLGFFDGLATVKIGKRWGFINKTGKIVISPQFDLAHDFMFSEGLAGVKVGSKWGFIDKTGKMVIKPQFDEAVLFSEGLAGVMIHGKCGYKDDTGMVVIEPQFDGAGKFSEGLATVKIENKWGFIDKTSRLIINPQFDDVGWSGFSEGLAGIKVGNMWGFINKTGKLIINPQFNDIEKISGFSEGLVAVKIGNKWGFIDKTGRIVIKPQFDDAWRFSEELAPVKIGNKWGFIGKTGKIVIEPQFDKALSFYNGCALVWIGDTMLKIDRREYNVGNFLFYGKTDNLFMYYDTKTISRPSGNIIRVWIKNVFTEKGVTQRINEFGIKYEKLSHCLSLLEFDCVDKKSRILSSIYYTKDGEVIESFKWSVADWEFIVPNSIGEALYKKLCK